MVYTDVDRIFIHSWGDIHTYKIRGEKLDRGVVSDINMVGIRNN